MLPLSTSQYRIQQFHSYSYCFGIFLLLLIMLPIFTSCKVIFILSACTECTQQVQLAPIKVFLVSTLSRDPDRGRGYRGPLPTLFIFGFSSTPSGYQNLNIFQMKNNKYMHIIECSLNVISTLECSCCWVLLDKNLT